MDVGLGLAGSAARALAEAQAEGPVRDPVLVVQAGDLEECCTVGFDVALASRDEVPLDRYTLAGEVSDWSVYLPNDLLSMSPVRVHIGRDRTSGALVALVLPGAGGRGSRA